MNLWFSLMGAAPALVAMAYVDRLDAKRPEPQALLRRVAIAGALSTVACVALALPLMWIAPEAHTYGHALYESFIVAAGVEELAKVLVVYWFVWHKPEFDERLDGIVYAARAGLGFALVENVLYLVSVSDHGEFIVTFILRALLAVPGHAIWAGIMGYFAAVRRFDHVGPGLIGGYLIAVFLHGSYDAAIFLGIPLRADGHHTIANLLMLALPAIIIGGGVALRRMARDALAADDRAEAREHLAAGASWWRIDQRAVAQIDRHQ